jgi:hypothetical protein
MKKKKTPTQKKPKKVKKTKSVYLTLSELRKIVAPEPPVSINISYENRSLAPATPRSDSYWKIPKIG